MDLFSRLFKPKSRKDVKVRIKIQHFHKIHLYINEEKYEVANISTSGIGFIDLNKKLDYFKGDHIRAGIKILDKYCDIELNIRHRNNELVGCKVVSSCELYQNYIENYFQSELEGLKLREIDRKSIQKKNEGNSFWFYGDSNHEIYFIEKENILTSFQINYNGQMVFYDGKHVQTGVLWEEEAEDVAYKASALIRPSEKLSKDMMEFIFRFVEVTNDINKLFKDQILKLLEEKFNKDWKE